MSIEDQLARAAQQMQQEWFNPATARRAQPHNDLSPASQQFELRVKLLEDRCDMLERILKRAGLLK